MIKVISLEARYIGSITGLIHEACVFFHFTESVVWVARLGISGIIILGAELGFQRLRTYNIIVATFRS